MYNLSLLIKQSKFPLPFPKSDIPRTMANVFVALRSFFAELFSRFFLLALFALYMVKRDPEPAFFLSFLQVDEADMTLGVRASGRGRRETVLFNLFNSCLFVSPPFFFGCEAWLVAAAPLAGGEDEVEDDGADAIRGFGLGLEFVSSTGSCITAVLAAPSYPESFLPFCRSPPS